MKNKKNWFFYTMNKRCWHLSDELEKMVSRSRSRDWKTVDVKNHVISRKGKLAWFYHGRWVVGTPDRPAPEFAFLVYKDRERVAWSVYYHLGGE